MFWKETYNYFGKDFYFREGFKKSDLSTFAFRWVGGWFRRRSKKHAIKICFRPTFLSYGNSPHLEFILKYHARWGCDFVLRNIVLGKIRSNKIYWLHLYSDVYKMCNVLYWRLQCYILPTLISAVLTVHFPILFKNAK